MGGLDGDHLDKRPRFQRGLSGDQGDVCAAQRALPRQGVAHLAAGAVGVDAHRVDRFTGGPGGDQHLFAGQILGVEDLLQDVVVQQLLFWQLSRADILAGQHPDCRVDDAKAVAAQRFQVVLGDGVFVHVGVHRGGHQLFAAAGQHGGGEHVVGDAVGHLGDDVGRGRSDHHKVGTLGERHMLDVVLEVAVEGVDHAAGVAQRLKGQWGDELGGVFGHDDLHVAVLFGQHAGDVGHLVGGNRAGDAQHDGFSFKHKKSFLLLCAFKASIAEAWEEVKTGSPAPMERVCSGCWFFCLNFV